MIAVSITHLDLKSRGRGARDPQECHGDEEGSEDLHFD